MSEQNINTTESVKEAQKGKKPTKADIEKSITKYESVLGKQKVMKLSIPKAMSSVLQNPLFVSVNGVSMVIPIDGEEHWIPEVLYNHAVSVINNAK